LTARVHPGESIASWMMKGALEFLTSEAPEAVALRHHFVFKIVPMLNPDGVINGNYRCSLIGCDLNRRFKFTSRVLYPSVYYAKKMALELSKERELALYCDMHGHSRKTNVFMYGNTISHKPEATRLFPFVMSKLFDFFSYDFSRFNMPKSKESTARVNLFREMKSTNVYTLEASFLGPDIGQYEGEHFTPAHLMEMGRKAS
jgi:hypothetical protein